MLAYPMPTWHWPHPLAAHGESHPAVSTLLGKLNSHLQRNLIQSGTGNDQGHMIGGRSAPSAIHPLGESVSMAPTVRECVAARHRSRQLVTAVRTAQNQLTLDSWRVNADGSVIRTGTSGPQTEPVGQIALARAAKYVVAYRTDAQQVKLVSWDVSNTGAIYRAGESAPWPEPVRKLTLCAPDAQTLVTACVMRNRRLKLIAWRLDADAGIVALYVTETSDEAVRSVVMTPLPSYEDAPHFATMIRTAAGGLAVQRWQTTPDGTLVSRGRDELMAPGSQIQAVVHAQQHLVAAIRTVAGEMRLLSWRWRTPEEQLELVDDTTISAGVGDTRARSMGLISVSGGVIAVLNTCHHKVKLVAWGIGPDGMLQRGVESAPRPITAGPIALCPDLLDGNAPILAGLQTSQGLFKLTSWHI